MTNPKRKGYYRDRAILEAIERYTALETEQVKVLLFPFKTGLRKAQERLLNLYKNGQLSRHKFEDGQFCYYFKRPGMLTHLLGVNWIRIWLELARPSWEKLQSFSYEQDYKILRCDGFAAIKNLATSKFNFYFVEMDRGTNEFDKVEKYCKLFSCGGYDGRWWVKLTDRFPTVLVVTTSESRAEQIKQIVKQNNTQGLKFEIKILEEIKKEVV